MKVTDWTVLLLSLFLVAAVACSDQIATGTATPSVTSLPTATLAAPATGVPAPTLTSTPRLAPAVSLTAITTPTPGPVENRTPAAETALVLSLNLPTDQVFAPGSEVFLEVQLDPRGRGISGAQFHLEVSPQQLSVLDISPGEVLGPEPVEIKSFGGASGRTIYAAARRGPTQSPTPAGTLAIVRARVSVGADPGSPVQMGLQGVKIADGSLHEVSQVVVAAPVELAIGAP